MKDQFDDTIEPSPKDASGKQGLTFDQSPYKIERSTIHNHRKNLSIETKNLLDDEQAAAEMLLSMSTPHTPGTKPYSAPHDGRPPSPRFQAAFNLTNIDNARSALLAPESQVKWPVQKADHSDDDATYDDSNSDSDPILQSSPTGHLTNTCGTPPPSTEASTKGKRSPLAGKPATKAWNATDDAALIDIVRKLDEAGMTGDPLWHAAEVEAKKIGIDRTWNGLRLRWARKLRVMTGIDERRKKNPEHMQTALQTPKKRKRMIQGGSKSLRRTKTSISQMSSDIQESFTEAMDRKGSFLSSDIDGDLLMDRDQVQESALTIKKVMPFGNRIIDRRRSF